MHRPQIKQSSRRRSHLLKTMLLLGFGMLCAASVGCGGSNVLPVEYGPSRGSGGLKSVNGFGGLRETYESLGWETRSINRLGDRMMHLDAIVWTPLDSSTIRWAETNWYENWLAEGDKTLIYVVFDEGSSADYWRSMVPLANPDQRFEYRRRAARAQIVRDKISSKPAALGTQGWFSLETLPVPQPIKTIENAEETVVFEATPADAQPELLYRVVPFKESNPSNRANINLPLTTITADFSEEMFSTAEVSLTEYLQTADGLPLVTEITSPEWKGSKVFVVSGGSLVTNYALTTPQGRITAASIIRESGKPGKLGFLVSDATGIRVSDAYEAENRKTGMELLTVWPLSLVSIHLALIGLVACLIMLPIFGRPRKGKQKSQSDFSDHLNAVASLLDRTDSDLYARQKINEYMRRVRGETSGPWVIDDKPPQPTDKSGESQ